MHLQYSNASVNDSDLYLLLPFICIIDMYIYLYIGIYFYKCLHQYMRSMLYIGLFCLLFLGFPYQRLASNCSICYQCGLVHTLKCPLIIVQVFIYLEVQSETRPSLIAFSIMAIHKSIFYQWTTQNPVLIIRMWLRILILNKSPLSELRDSKFCIQFLGLGKDYS